MRRLFQFDTQAIIKMGIRNMFGQDDPIFDGKRIDAFETATYARKLEQVLAKVYEVEYPDAPWRTLFPLNYEVAPGAESFTFTLEDVFGDAQIIQDYAEDFPTSELQGKQINASIKGVGVAFQYSLQDLRAATMANVDLPSRKAVAARKNMERKLDALACNGDANTGLKGLFSSGNGIISVTKGTQGTGTTWVNGSGVIQATAQEIHDDVAKMSSSVYSATLGLHMPTDLVVGTKAYQALMYGTVTNAAGFTPNTKLGDYLLATIPNLKRITHWNRLDTAGTAAAERIFMYSPDPELIECVIPQEFEQFPPMQRGLAWRVLGHMRTGGIKLTKPKSVSYIDVVN